MNPYKLPKFVIVKCDSCFKTEFPHKSHTYNEEHFLNA